MRDSRKVLAAACAAFVSMALCVVPANADDKETDFGPTPPRGDCRDHPGATCTNDARTGETMVSPRVLKEGETLSVSFSLLPGGVSFQLPQGPGLLTDCKDKTESRKVEVADKDGRYSLEEKDVPISTSCSFKPKATLGKWSTMSVGVTGPCGSQIAVQQGKAEYAICAGTYDSDYFGVLDKNDPRSAISGRVSLSSGRGLVGVPVHLSGPESKTAMTSATGDYYFLVKKGTYTVRPDAKVCATSQHGTGCSSTATVTVPGSKTVNFGPDGEGTVDGTIRDSGGDPVPGVTVRVVGPSGQVTTTNDKGYYSVVVPKGTFEVSASKLVDGTGTPTVPARQRVFCAARTGAGSGDCPQTATVEVPPDATVDFTPKEDPGLLLSLEGDKGVQHGLAKLVLTVSNTRTVPVEGLQFGDPLGLAVTSLAADGKTPATTPVVSLTAGPSPALPTTLGAKASVTIAYQYAALSVGDASVSAKVQATLPDGKVIKSFEEGTLSVSDRDITRDDLARAAIGGIRDALAMGADAKQQVSDLMAEGVRGTLSRPDATAAEQAAAAAIGLPARMAGLINESIDNQKDFIATFGTEFLDAVDRDGKAGGELVNNVVNTINDPEARDAIARALWEGAKELPGATARNLGYLFDAIDAAPTVEGLKTIIAGNAKMLSSVAEGTGQAVQGYREMTASAVELAKTDPKAARRALAKSAAQSTEIVVRDVMVGVATEGFSVAGKAVSGRVIGGLKALSGAEAAAAEAALAGQGSAAPIVGEGAAGTGAGAALAGDGASAAATQRLAAAEAAYQTLQDLPYGTVLDAATLTSKAGFNAADVEAIDQLLIDVEKMFGIKLEIVARPSEPLSAGIDGVGKREFVKFKAVSVRDKLLGANPEFAGRASVFDPVRPSEEVLQGLEALRKGERDDVLLRFEEQKELWDSWKVDPATAGRKLTPTEQATYDKGVRFLVDASAKYEKGITVLVDRPGNRLPNGLRYLEQLNEPDFVLQHKLDPGQVTALREKLTGFNAAGKRTGAGHPDRYLTKIVAETKDGTTTFLDALANKPIVSDLDLQAVRPLFGPWPEGKRAAVEAFVKRRLGDLERFPGHLWSDAGIDLPADYLEACGKYELNYASLEAADDAAKSLERRFARMADLATKKASKIDGQVLELQKAANPDLKAIAALMRQSEDLRAKAKKFAANTAKALRAKYKSGEKGISFTRGVAKVSSGTGGR
jgi:hypothetical protein